METLEGGRSGGMTGSRGAFELAETILEHGYLFLQQLSATLGLAIVIVTVAGTICLETLTTSGFAGVTFLGRGVERVSICIAGGVRTILRFLHERQAEPLCRGYPDLYWASSLSMRRRFGL